MPDLLAALAAPVHALPLDLLRIWAGGIVFVYFLQAYRHSGDFSDPDGLIDHRLVAKLLPATRWSFFRPGMSGRVFRAVYLCACVAAVLVSLGVHPRACAVFLFAAAVSTYRWNVLVAYLDDSIVHIFCLWLVLLPVGHTLAPGAEGDPAATLVPGAAPRAFMANMALIYLVAGAYKFTSPMWRNGSAVHAALRMPIARTPGFWTMRRRPILRVANYAALALEPFFGLVFVLPSHSPVKWLLAACAVVFHLGIVATLKIPYSNLLMLGALPMAFGPEIGTAISGSVPPGSVAATLPQSGSVALDPSAVALDPSAVVALVLVAVLVAMFAWEAAAKWCPISRPYSTKGWANPLRAALWLAGVFQSYRLFDWVDSRNYHVRYELHGLAAGSQTRQALDASALFDDTMRHLLLQSYLIDNVWLQMDADDRAAVRRAILARYAARYARSHPNAGTLEAWAVVQRVTADNLDLTRGERRFVMRFSCRDGVATVHNVDDAPTPAGG